MTTTFLRSRDDESGAEERIASHSTAQSSKLLNSDVFKTSLTPVFNNVLFSSLIRTTSDMILPNEHQPPSSFHDDGDGDQATPPPYQETVTISQLLPSELLTTSVYAPSVSSRSDPPGETEKELPRHPSFPDEKSGEKGKEMEGSAQHPLGVLSMFWSTASNTPTSSGSPNQASTSHTSVVQVRDPLNPAPAAFTRPTPKDYTYLPFQPLTMLGISPKLADGFPLIPPPINSEDEASVGKANAQHPFVSHDVTEEDWLK